MPSPDLSPISQFSASLTDLVAGVSPSLVTVRSHRALSTGFVLRPGLVVTADEALAEEGDVTVIPNSGDAIPASIVGRDPSTDIALLRIERQDLPPAPLTDTAPAAGALVLAVGAQDGGATASLGVIGCSAGPWHSVRGGDIDARIELDLRLRRRAEGGLAIDALGRAFGMPVYGPRRTTLVIPTATIERVAALLERHGRIPRGYLGLGLQPVTVSGTTQAGALVVSIDPKGPGAAAGLFQGDIVTAWNGATLSGLRALLRSLGPQSVGQEAALTIRRGGEVREVRLTVGERLAN